MHGLNHHGLTQQHLSTLIIHHVIPLDLRLQDICHFTVQRIRKSAGSRLSSSSGINSPYTIKKALTVETFKLKLIAYLSFIVIWPTSPLSSSLAAVSASAPTQAAVIKKQASGKWTQHYLLHSWLLHHHTQSHCYLCVFGKLCLTLWAMYVCGCLSFLSAHCLGVVCLPGSRLKFWNWKAGDGDNGNPSIKIYIYLSHMPWCHCPF